MNQAIKNDLNDLRSVETWRATSAEFIATLLFVFVGAGSVVVTGTLTDGVLTAPRLIAIALGHGLTITLLVYATANLSGGHINPAVTFAAALARKITATKAGMYVVAQLLGAILGAFLLKLALPEATEGNLGAHALGPEVTVSMAVLIEVIITFMLVFVVFATAIDPQGMGRLAPMAIGLTVLVGHILAVPLTGASMNPARSLGPAAISGVWVDHWVYWVAPLVGAAIGGVLYQAVFIGRAVVKETQQAFVPIEARPSSERVGLNDVDIFKGLSADQVQSVESLGRRSHISAGDMLGTAKQIGDNLYVVIEGRAEASAQGPMGEVAVRVVGPGETFPVAALIGSHTLVTSVKALTDMELLVIPQSALTALCSENSEIGMRVFASVAELSLMRYRRTLGDLVDNSERLRSGLLSLESRELWPF